MRLLIFFTPPYLEWGYDLVEEVARNDQDLEVIALCSSRRIFAKVEKHVAAKGWRARLSCMEHEEERWLDTPVSSEDMARMDARMEPDIFNKFIIADRLIGSGYLTDADATDSKLARAARSMDILKRYVYGAMAFFERMIDSEKPDAAFLYCIAGGYSYGLSRLLKLRDTPFFQLQPGRVQDFYIADTSTEGNLEPLDAVYERLAAHPEQIKPEHEAFARQWIADFRAAYDILPAYEIVNRKKKRVSLRLRYHLFRIVRASLRWAAYKVAPDQILLRAASPANDLVQAVLYPVRLIAMERAKWFKTEGEVYKDPYVFFPLHVSPEASTMVLAPHHSQHTVIEALSKTVPLHMKIVVKEHPMMVGLRPLSFYRYLNGLPNVCLVETDSNTQRLIDNAALVATITGTAGWEAVVRGRPVVVFGGPSYRILDVALNHCSDLSRLDEGIRDALKKPVCPDLHLIAYIAAIQEIGFRMDSNILHEGVSEELRRAHQPQTALLARLLIEAGAKDQRDLIRRAGTPA